jgi:hypothetical protein
MLKLWRNSFLVLFLLVLPKLAAAEELSNPLGQTDIRLIIGNIISALLGIAGAVSLLMFVWGGFQWLISGGTPDRIKKGKDTLIWATIGLVVIFTSYAIVRALITALTTGSI